MDTKAELEYSAVIKNSRISKLAVAAAISGTFGTLCIYMMLGLWSIDVEGFDEWRTASEGLRLIWSFLSWAAILTPLGLSCAAAYSIKKSAGQLRGLGLAFLGAIVPVAFACFELASVL